MSDERIQDVNEATRAALCDVLRAEGDPVELLIGWGVYNGLDDTPGCRETLRIHLTTLGVPL